MTRGRFRRHTATVGLVLAALATEAAARAADVGIVATDPNDAFVTRLVLELEQMGFTVARAPSVAASRDAAVVDISDAAIELHVGTNARRTRRVVASRADTLKVAEEVHALLLPLVASPPRAPLTKPTAESPPERTGAPASQPATRFEVSVGAGALMGTSSPGLGLTAGATVVPRALRFGSASLGVGIFGLFSAVPESVTSTAGSADAQTLLGGAEAIGRVQSAARFAVDAAVGMSVNDVRFRGQARSPFTSREERATSLSPTLRLRTFYDLGRFGLFVEGRGGLSLPAIQVRFAGEAVAAWGRPWVCIGGGVALGF